MLYICTLSQAHEAAFEKVRLIPLSETSTLTHIPIPFFPIGINLYKYLV